MIYIGDLHDDRLEIRLEYKYTELKKILLLKCCEWNWKQNRLVFKQYDINLAI